MNSKNSFIFWLSYGIAIAAVAWMASVYPHLTDIFPVHWNVQGLPDRYAHKSNLLGLTALVLAIPLFMDFLPRIDPRRRNYDYFSSSYQYIKLGITAFMAFFLVLSIQTGRSETQILSTRMIMVGMGLLFMVLGNYMTKVRSNFFVGIKTPWTLSSDEVWRKTHRLGGWGFLLMGVLIIVAGFIFEGQVLFYLIIGAVLAVTIGLFLYSYLLYRSISKQS